MNRRVLLLAGLSLLAGCATTPPAVATSARSVHPELEPVYAAIAGREALKIEVASNGCTKKEDFAFHVERRGEAVTLAFGRRRLDPCRSSALGKVELSFTWAELGLGGHAQVFLLNPLAPSNGSGP
jgi:hypothetical protein